MNKKIFIVKWKITQMVNKAILMKQEGNLLNQVFKNFINYSFKNHKSFVLLPYHK